MGASAKIIPFPARRELTTEERAVIARWTSAARAHGISKVYVSARSADDPPEVQDRILIVQSAADGCSYVVHRPDRRWIVTSGVRFGELGSYAVLADALDAVRPLLGDRARVS